MISVIVPIYNTEKYLERCVNSILVQTYSDLEIILVDDGSTDKSVRMADKFAMVDSRVKVVHKGNGGIVSARKSGVKESNGEYITFVDSDDFIDNNMYEVMMRSIEGMEADVVTSGLIRDYIDHSVEESDCFPGGFYDKNMIVSKIWPIAIYTGQFFESGLNVHVTNKLFRSTIIKELIENIDEEICIGDDAAIVFSCVYNSKSIMILKEAFYHYVLRPDSISGSRQSNIIQQQRALYNYIMNSIDEQCSRVMIKKQLMHYILYSMLLMYPEKVVFNNNIHLLDILESSKRIVLYGDGKFGKAIGDVFKDYSRIKIVKWVSKTGGLTENCQVESVDELFKLEHFEYDYIFIAILKGYICENVKHFLIEKGINKNKIVFINPQECYVEKWFDSFLEES